MALQMYLQKYVNAPNMYFKKTIHAAYIGIWSHLW